VTNRLLAESGVAGGSSRHLVVCGTDSATPVAAWHLEQGGGGALVWSKGTGEQGKEVLHVFEDKRFIAVGGKTHVEEHKAEASEANSAQEESLTAYAKMMVSTRLCACMSAL
jgi:hypothetical protein